jgi:hypothetical protein
MTQAKETSLLAEGMRSYPKALAALNEFGRMVVSIVRAVVAEELASLSAAMRVELMEDELSDYVRPNRLAIPNPKDAILGVKIDRIGKSGWGLYSYLWWSKGVTKLSVSIWLRDGDAAESILAAFRKIQPTTPVEIDGGHEVYISRTLVPEDAEQLSAVLQGLSRDFSELWSKVSGLDRFLKA